MQQHKEHLERVAQQAYERHKEKLEREAAFALVHGTVVQEPDKG